MRVECMVGGYGMCLSGLRGVSGISLAICCLVDGCSHNGGDVEVLEMKEGRDDVLRFCLLVYLGD